MTDQRRSLINLAQTRLGARVLYATDDFFAPKERLIEDADPVFIPNKYDDHGKWMDGWESRRRRDGGHDYCVVHLGQPGVVDALEIDTSHFTGNYPPQVSVEAIHSSREEPEPEGVWTEIVPKMKLRGDDKAIVDINSDNPWTHLRLNIYPDGGVARLRVFGRCHIDWSQRSSNEVIDLIAIKNGGVAIACNDQHFGNLSNILAPEKGVNMGDGWETRRRRDPGADWGVIKLGHPGTIERVVIDTAFFKGNYPDRCSIQAIYTDSLNVDDLASRSEVWPVLLPEQKMSANTEHLFEREIVEHQAISHIRLNLIPDGGVSRLRLFGNLSG